MLAEKSLLRFQYSAITHSYNVDNMSAGSRLSRGRAARSVEYEWRRSVTMSKEGAFCSTCVSQSGMRGQLRDE